MPFTALATITYKTPGTTVWANSVKSNDDYLVTGVAKFYASWDQSAAVITSIQNLNVSNIADNGAGLFTLTLTTGFTSTGNMIFVGVQVSAAAETENGLGVLLTSTTNTVKIGAADANGVAQDVYRAMVVGFGRQS